MNACAARLAVLTLTAFGLSSSAAKGELRIQEAHTSTADVRDIEIYAGAVWVATGGGLAIHDAANGQLLRKLTSLEGLPGNSLRSLETHDEALLVGGDFGLAEVRWGGGAEEPRVKVLAWWFERYDPAFDILAGATAQVLQMHTGLRDLKAQPNLKLSGKAWKAAARGMDGVLLGAMDGTLRFVGRDQATDWPDLALAEPVLDIVADGAAFLVASGSRLIRYEAGRIQPLTVLGKGGRRINVPATTLATDDGKNVLVGTADGRIYQHLSGELRLEAQALPGRLTAVADVGGSLWFGTGKSGVFKIGSDTEARALRPAGEICGNHVARLVQHGHALVAATFDSGACALIDGAWQRLAGLPSEFVLGLASDGQELWAGTSNGLRRFDAALNPIASAPTSPPLLLDMESLATTAVVSLGPGEWAVSYLHGVAHVTTTEQGLSLELFKTRDGIPGHRTALAAMGRRLLIGSEFDGAVVFDLSSRRARRFLDPVHLPEAWVMDVSASRHELWIATCQSGVARLRGETSQVFDRGRGLPDNRVVAVAVRSSTAHVATLSGLAIIEASGTVHSLGLKDGLPDPRGSAVLPMTRGVWLGTEAGLAWLSEEH